MGKRKEHMKLSCTLSGGFVRVDVLKFKISRTYSAQFEKGDVIDILGTVSRNIYNNKELKQILLIDYRKA
jgi:hypothetical protein